MPLRASAAAGPPWRCDRKRATRIPGTLQAQVKLTLTSGKALARDGLQHLKPRIIVSRPDVLDVPKAPMRGLHDLHSHRTRSGLHRAHMRRHEATLRPRITVVRSWLAVDLVEGCVEWAAPRFPDS